MIEKMNKFVIKNEKNEFIGIDNASGGYPYETNNIQDAKIWNSKDAAREYKTSFPSKKWSLHVLNVNTQESGWT